mgnify:CR=1 FL=1
MLFIKYICSIYYIKHKITYNKLWNQKIIESMRFDEWYINYVTGANLNVFVKAVYTILAQSVV